MQTKTLVTLTAQIMTLVMFGVLAGASGSSKAVVQTPITYRADVGTCSDPDFMYVGTFVSESDAVAACQRLGLTEHCMKGNQCYGK